MMIFFELYDCISHFIGERECSILLEEDMRLHILGLLYDIRHAYQGDRNIRAVDNGLTEEDKRYYGINKSAKQDILYSFDYVLTDLLTDILLFKYFAKKKAKEINEYNTEYNTVMAFFSKVVDSLSEILTSVQIKKVKKLFINSNIYPKSWVRQWYMIISINYINMTKEKRKKEIMHVIKYICEYNLYDEYFKIEKEVEEYAKKNNLHIVDIEYGNYPEEVEW